jgi:hypothetical protein
MHHELQPFLLHSFLVLTAVTSGKHSWSQPNECLQGWHLSSSFSSGKVWAHTPRFEPEVSERSMNAELSISRQLRGHQPWQYVYRYPFFGVAFTYTRFGNDEVLGSAWACLPYFEVVLAGKDKLLAGNHGFSLSLRVGTGLAYLDKHYDAISNPKNNVIGSAWNNKTQLDLLLQYKTGDHFTFLAGGTFSHYSSGGIRKPNLGINLPAVRLGFRYQPKPYERSQFLQPSIPAAPQKYFFELLGGIGFHENVAPYGGHYRIYLFEASSGRLLSTWNLLAIGTQVHFKELAHAYYLSQPGADSSANFMNAIAAAGFLKDDFLIGNLGITVALGGYFYSPSPLQSTFYQEVGCYYALPFRGDQSPTRLLIGMNMNVSDFNADFVSLETGLRF